MAKPQMTDEEVAAANAEYDAMPGTPPDGWSFIEGRPTRDDVRARLAEWKDMAFYRITEVDDPGVWIEVWKVAPRKQAEFNPPYVAVLQTEDSSNA